MITLFKIDQAATFQQGVAYLSCEPKTAFGQKDVQETAKDGTPKWEAQILVMTKDSFGKIVNEVLKVGLLSHRNPCADVPMMSPVQLVNFEVGVMDKTKRLPDGTEKILGSQVWFRAEAIRPLTATPEPRGAKASASA